MIGQFYRWFVHPHTSGTVPYLSLLMLVVAVFGSAFLLTGVRLQWDDTRYGVDGLRTDSGRVVAKWKVTREGAESSTITEYWVHYRYLDNVGHAHEHYMKWQHQEWIAASPGDPLPTIQYLATKPRIHRYVIAAGAARRAFWLGMALLAAVPCVRLGYACVHGFRLTYRRLGEPYMRYIPKRE